MKAPTEQKKLVLVNIEYYTGPFFLVVRKFYTDKITYDVSVRTQLGETMVGTIKLNLSSKEAWDYCERLIEAFGESGNRLTIAPGVSIDDYYDLTLENQSLG